MEVIIGGIVFVLLIAVGITLLVLYIRAKRKKELATHCGVCGARYVAECVKDYEILRQTSLYIDLSVKVECLNCKNSEVKIIRIKNAVGECSDLKFAIMAYFETDNHV